MKPVESSKSPSGSGGAPALRPAEERLQQLIGLAARAGQIVTGAEAVFAAIRNRKAKLVLLAADSGANADKKYRDKCAFYHIPLTRLLDRTALGRACGRSQCVAIAVTNPGFAAEMSGIAGELRGGEAFDETSGV